MLKTSRLNSLFWSCAMLTLAAVGVSTKLSANTITMDDYNGQGNTVSCGLSLDIDCAGFVGPITGPVTLSNTDADVYDMPGNSSPAAQLGLLNALLSEFEPARAPVLYVNKTDDEDPGFTGINFTTNRQYFSIKKGTEMWFFENLSSGLVTVNLEGDTEEFSNWTEYGAVVPVPAAFWLFGTALIGFIGYSRRTKV